MERKKIIYAVIAFVLTIGIALFLNKWLVVLNQMGTDKYAIGIIYFVCFIQLCSLVEAVHKMIRKIDTKSNVTVVIMNISGVIAIIAVLIGMFSTLENRLLILIIFCASFLTFLGMGGKAINIEKSK